MKQKKIKLTEQEFNSLRSKHIWIEVFAILTPLTVITLVILLLV